MSRNLIVSVAIAALAAFGAYWVTSTPDSASAVPEFQLGAANAQEAAEIDTSSVVEMELGNPDAPLTVVEYASYTCPHCATFHAGVYQQLKADYIDTGKVHFVYREVYFDRLGLWASLVSRCGGEQRFFGITSMLYDQQRDWIGSGDGAEVVANLRRIGKVAGLDDAALDACLSDQDKAQTLVAWFQQNAQADGISSTPSFVIDGTTYQNMSYADFQSILDEKLGE
jgi:protein-disulfide isomerase